ncbi:small ribosomal subunit protein mS31 [Anabrus simplex]|uniref:small ribosomal subunit protein mS31 n=1 Tax=Anabrus simplex TaxID=316456 RepID=UPI0035A2BE37
MFSLSIILRNRCLRTSPSLQLKTFLSTSKDESGHSDSSDDEKETNRGVNNKDALKRLNFLLQSMVKEEKRPSSSALDNKLAQPKGQARKERQITDDGKDISAPKHRASGDALVDAAKEVAESMGGDVKQTESELLSKLQSHSATSTKGNGEQESQKPSISLSELIVGMKIDRSPKTPKRAEYSRAHQVRKVLSSQQRRRGEMDIEMRPMRERKFGYPRPEIPTSTVNLFGGELLGIFPPSSELKPMEGSLPELKIWERLQEKELKLAITHPPSNIYEEMIQWTERGKLWNFPIDNEQGLEEEAQVYFTEHVFLEHHLEPWCPRQGPIRRFMELVCVGLSKNPYITVQDKREHIEWFRQYFEKKQDLLAQVGALGNVPKLSHQEGIES